MCAEKRVLELERKLIGIRDALEEIVVPYGQDAGVILLSGESLSDYDEKAGCHVYKHQYFSPLGDALVALWQSLEDRCCVCGGKLDDDGTKEKCHHCCVGGEVQDESESINQAQYRK